MQKWLAYILLSLFFFISCGSDDDGGNQPTPSFAISAITIDNKTNQNAYVDVDPQNLLVTLKFSDKIDYSSVEDNIQLKNKSNAVVDIAIDYDGDKNITLKPLSGLDSYAQYVLTISNGLISSTGAPLKLPKSVSITTRLDYLSDKFPRISDDKLLDLVQEQTFKYFWDFGHPTSGMARERTTSGNTVATGGTGFGVMAMIVAVERGFITHDEALARTQKIVTFLDTKCTAYHGAYAHWVNGETGATMPFSTYDDGADLVETALLFQGLLTARQYFKASGVNETKLRNDITRLWEQIEWTWFQKGGEKGLYWHWSPNHGWQINMKISGWNESLIVYALAAASPTHPISKDVYEEGWARNGAFRNGQSYHGYQLPLGPEYGGPLFLSQYSFLGINPKDLTDQYVNYWNQNKNHTLINRGYCIANPKGYAAYSADCWGLTASDGKDGYNAHSPTNDKGVIAPTAAISAMPYTPEESMKALHFFYYKLGDKLWSEYGFYDAFSVSGSWFDNQHIAIDQGPIIVMIENHRTELLWNLFMADPEIKAGLTKLGFQSPNL